MPNPVTWFEITGKSGPNLMKYYADVFGWKVDANNPMAYGMVDTQSGKGIYGGIGAAQDAKGWVTIGIEVDDPQVYLDKAIAMGGTLVEPVTVIPNMVTLGRFADPDGNMVIVYKGMSPNS